MTDNGLNNLDSIFQSAQEDGLTNETMDLVVSNLDGPAMTGAVGIPLTQLTSNELLLAMNIIDRSGSMHGYATDLIGAYNDEYLAAMRESSSADEIMVSTILFNDEIALHHGYVNVGNAPPLTRQRYNPGGTTALYDAVAAGLTNMVLYVQQLRQAGVTARCLVIVYSDGEDNASRQDARTVRRAVGDLLRHEMYTFAYVGFRQGGIDETETRALADIIGFPNVLAAGLSAQELRRIFHMASVSAVRVSRHHASPASLF